MQQRSRQLRAQLTGRLIRDILSRPERDIMPGQIRPDKKIMKAAYKILKTPKDLQQSDNKEPNPRRLKAWRVDSSISPRYN